MNITLVDSYTLNPGDLSWNEIKSLGEVTIFERTAATEIVERCNDAEIILTNKVPFSRETLKQLPALKLICVTATGYNIVDIEETKKRNIVVCNVPDYGSDSVAQHTFALLLELSNRVGQHTSSVFNGDWKRSLDFSYALTPLIELRGKSLGLVGFGSIGKRTAEIGNAFGMDVSYYTPSKKETVLAKFKELDKVFEESDFISLHLPLTDQNSGFINQQLLKLMKPDAFLINTSRGQLINERDLAEALNNESIAGAALDVLSAEPPISDNPLLSAKNCIITPHIAWMSKAARERIMTETIRNVKAFLDGQIVNRVN